MRMVAPIFGRMVHGSAIRLTMMRISSMPTGIALDDVVVAAEAMEGYLYL
jgi:hypothetical protein